MSSPPQSRGGSSQGGDGQCPHPVQRATYRERDIQQRTFAFAVRVVKMVRRMPSDTAGQIVARQLARSATSVGANIEEAQGAQSKIEFSRKMTIARGEARETLYWLRLVREAGLLPAATLTAIVQEAEELVKILTTIVKRSRQSESATSGK